MRKNLFLMFACALVISMFSCTNDDEDNKVLKVPDQKELNQTPYANTNIASVAFNAPQPWTASIAEVKEVAIPVAKSWISLDKYKGDAGSTTLNIQLETNYTGSDRSAKITIASGEASVQVSVTQKAVKEDGQKPVDPHPVTSVALSKDTISLVVNAKDTLVASVLPQNATIKTLVWSSSDNKIATVSQIGEVVAIAKGTAVITATSTADGTKNASCQVFVREERATTGTGVFSYALDSDTTKVYKLNVVASERLYSKIDAVYVDSISTAPGALYQLKFYEEGQIASSFYVNVLAKDGTDLVPGTYRFQEPSQMIFGHFYTGKGMIGGKTFHGKSGTVVVEKRENTYRISVLIRTTEDGKNNTGYVKGSYSGVIPTIVEP